MTVQYRDLIKTVPPVSFNGNAHVEKKEVIPANKQDDEGEENVGFAEDSAL